MKTNKMLITLMLAVALLGCGKQQPRHIVILPDVSGSIDRQSLEQAFKAIGELAGHLHRGDRLTIIPILSDAEVEASGRVIRFEMPLNRQAYDTDIRKFQTKLSSSLKQMQTNAIAHPGSKTDILGTTSIAEQEFRVGSSYQKRLLVILSDFIQDDANFNFRTDQRLISLSSTKAFAIKITRAGDCDFRGTRIYLGLMRSNEYAMMSRTRRQGIQEFWMQYFTSFGGQPKFLTDGPGLLRVLQ